MRSPPGTSPTPVFSFPVANDSKAWDLPQRKLDEYQATYSDRLDVSAELRKARQWLIDHKARRKTRQGMAGFLTRWLNRAYDGTPTTRTEDDHGLQRLK